MSERLITLLRETRNKRIPLEALRRCFRNAHPELSDSPECDRLLLEALQGLAAGGQVSLPAEGSWERFGNPRMPKWISLVVAPVSSVVDWRAVPWVPEMGFWVELQPRQLDAARAINDFLLRRRGKLVPVPLNERSLEIFGDEKRLAAMATGESLFGGKLSLAAIGAFHVATPLPYRAAPASGKPLLIVENHHSYWSFGEWNLRNRQFAAVVYGSGNEFAKSGIALDQVLSETGANVAEYLGDLDPAGLAIPAGFSAKRRGLGLSEVRPAERFYSWLLEQGVRQRRIERYAGGPDTAGIAWLPERLRVPARELFEAGFRIPQESLGYEILLRAF
ncbi:MAG: hypothetical protein EPO20_15530 [Betaproteobacteria bacterium]|nr:MAG: hypothetical protein EPO20_15530 [Betaproteobacteria bacterium]